MKLFLSISKKLIILLLLILFSKQISFAQNSKSDFWTHVRYGGGLGLNFGDKFFSATVAPSAIYQFDKKLSLGLGLNATFNNQKAIYKSTILGGSLVGLYNVIREIQLSTEFEQLNVNRRYNVNLNEKDDNYWIPGLYLGVGYRSKNVTFGIRYDVLYDSQKSIYADPWAPFVRVYF